MRNPASYVTDLRPVEGVEYENRRDLHEWATAHSRTHTALEKTALHGSGLWLLPEAAYKLAAYGIIPLQDLVQDDEVKDALRQAPASPENEPEHITHIKSYAV
jgi:hypothetical protein